MRPYTFALPLLATLGLCTRASTGTTGNSAAVVNAIGSCSLQVKACDSAVLSLGAAGADEVDIAASFSALLSAFDSACSTVKEAAGSFELADVLTISSALRPLQLGCGQLIADIVAKRKAILAKLGSCSAVAGFGVQVQGSAKTLLEAVLGRVVPGGADGGGDALQGIAQFIVELSGSFDVGIWAFGQGNCTNSGSGSAVVSASATENIGGGAGATLSISVGGGGSGYRTRSWTRSLTKTVKESGCPCTEKTTLATATATPIGSIVTTSTTTTLGSIILTTAVSSSPASVAIPNSTFTFTPTTSSPPAVVTAGAAHLRTRSLELCSLVIVAACVLL